MSACLICLLFLCLRLFVSSVGLFFLWVLSFCLFSFCLSALSICLSVRLSVYLSFFQSAPFFCPFCLSVLFVCLFSVSAVCLVCPSIWSFCLSFLSVYLVCPSGLFFCVSCLPAYVCLSVRSVCVSVLYVCLSDLCAFIVFLSVLSVHIFGWSLCLVCCFV